MSRRPQAGGASFARISTTAGDRQWLTKTLSRAARAAGKATGAAPPNALPAACVQDAERPGPRPIAPCAGTVAKSGARPSAQGARRPRRPVCFTAAEMLNGAAGARVTGPSGETGHGGTLACARAAAQIHPLKAARCANRAAWHGVTGGGTNMPCDAPPPCAAGAARRRPVMPPTATDAPGARPNARERRPRTPEAASVTSGGACEGFA